MNWTQMKELIDLICVHPVHLWLKKFLSCQHCAGRRKPDSSRPPPKLNRRGRAASVFSLVQQAGKFHQAAAALFFGSARLEPVEHGHAVFDRVVDPAAFVAHVAKKRNCISNPTK